MQFLSHLIAELGVPTIKHVAKGTSPCAITCAYLIRILYDWPLYSSDMRRTRSQTSCRLLVVLPTSMDFLPAKVPRTHIVRPCSTRDRQCNNPQSFLRADLPQDEPCNACLWAHLEDTSAGQVVTPKHKLYNRRHAHLVSLGFVRVQDEEAPTCAVNLHPSMENSKAQRIRVLVVRRLQRQSIKGIRKKVGQVPRALSDVQIQGLSDARHPPTEGWRGLRTDRLCRCTRCQRPTMS